MGIHLGSGDMGGVGELASLYLASLFMLLIAPAWIGMLLLSIALVMTLMAIRQIRNRPTTSPLVQQSEPPRDKASRNGLNDHTDEDIMSSFAAACLIIGIIVGFLVFVLFVRYSLWVSSCGPGGCL